MSSEIQGDVSDVRTLVSIRSPAFAQEVVDLLGTLSWLRHVKGEIVRILRVRRVLLEDQTLVDFFIAQG